MAWIVGCNWYIEEKLMWNYIQLQYYNGMDNEWHSTSIEKLFILKAESNEALIWKVI